METIKVLKKNEDFQNIFDKGHSIYSRNLVVYFLQNQTYDLRFGFCVGKKIGNAVVRNRIKRLFREVARLEVWNQISGWDLVLVARHPVLQATLNDITRDMKYILTKAKVYNSSDERKDSC